MANSPRITQINSVYFDLNTLFDDRYAITQIGAVHAGSERQFDLKIKLAKNNTPNIYKTLKGALKDFFKWLQELKNLTKEDGLFLIAHNAFACDKLVLEGAAGQNGVSIPDGLVHGYIDSLHAFRNHFNIEGAQPENFKLNKLAKYFGEGRQTHDALDDSLLLKKITLKARNEKKMRMNNFFKDYLR